MHAQMTRTNGAQMHKCTQAQKDLLAPVDSETWLLNRLKQHGIDVYDGEFDCLRDRVAWAIVSYGYGPIVAGRHNGKPETYEQLIERMYAAKLKDIVKRLKEIKAAKEAAA